MRLMQRTIVDLPHPDGPMIAVTSLRAELEVDALDLFGLAVEGAQLLEADGQPGAGPARRSRRWPARTRRADR